MGRPATGGGAERVPAAGRTLVFSRAQMKYGLDGHYLRQWVDRPLFIDPALRVAERPYAMAMPSYRRMLAIVASYGLDGFAFFPETSGRMGAFEYTDQAAVPGVSLLPEFVATDSIDAKREVLRAAAACRSCVRVNGRLLITSYHADSLTPERWKNLLTALRADAGGAPFVFLPDITRPCGEGWADWIARFDSTDGIGAADRDRLRRYLRAYAGAADGLHMAAVAAVKKNRLLHDRFYREFLAPMFRDVLAEPGMRGKLLGLSACVAHINSTRLGYTLGDDGTRTLRHSFEAALAVRPDVIVIPEWDEQNENTSLRPTVDDGCSSRRLLRHYMGRIRGEPLAPLPGDDLALPDLVLSYRKLLTLGEELRLEILNIPEGTGRPPFTTRLALRALDGRIVHRFPVRTFDRTRLAEVTEILPSEQVAAHPALVPEIEIGDDTETRVVDRGWHPIQIRPTWNWDYKWVKQAVRDLAPVHECRVALDWPEDSTDATLECRLACDEPLASVEVIEDGAVVYAVDPRPDALRELRDHVMLAFEYRAARRRAVRGHVRVTGSACRWPASYRVPSYSWQLDDTTLRLKRYADGRQNVACRSVPERDAASAALEFEVGDFGRTVPIREILERGLIAYHDGRDLTVIVSRFLKQDDHPPHLHKREVAFRARLNPDMAASLFHVRAITESGRIFRSRPMHRHGLDDGPPVDLPVWSETRDAPVPVRVSAARVPDIRYQIADRHGAALVTDAGRPFWGVLGGFTDSVTARGGDGGSDGSPFIQEDHYPKDAPCTAPRWCVEDGRTALRFDGQGTYIALPQGALPRRGAFRLRLVIKPTSDKPQTLFAHRRHYIGSLTLGLDRGRLRAAFTNEAGRTYAIRSELAVPAGQWSTVEAIYDLGAMRLRVNGREAGPFECRGVGLYDMTSVVGGFGGGAPPAAYADSRGWFDGYLAALEISHNCR